MDATRRLGIKLGAFALIIHDKGEIYYEIRTKNS